MTWAEAQFAKIVCMVRPIETYGDALAGDKLLAMVRRLIKLHPDEYLRLMEAAKKIKAPL
jgi:hypothetical protein